MMKNNKKKIWILLGVIIVAAVVIGIWAVAPSTKNPVDNEGTQPSSVIGQETGERISGDNGPDTENETGRVQAGTDRAEQEETQKNQETGGMEPDTGILGFKPAQEEGGTEARREPEETGAADETEGNPAAEAGGITNGLNLPCKIPGTDLKIVQLGKYTGPFLEDGSDEPLANVASLVIENASSRTLQYAELVFQVNDNETASFRLTTIPSGSRVLVMESSKREYSKEDVYRYQDSTSVEMEEPDLMEEKLKITAQAGKITVENLTNEDLGMVYVRYKYFLSEDLYQGGITYETKFEKVGPGGVVEKEAPHYKEGGSRLMMAGYASEEDMQQ